MCEAVGIARATYYYWLNDKDIMAVLDKRRLEIKDEGMRYIKGRYKKYLTNIDKICDDLTDRRSCLAANQFMVEKMDGKNTTKLGIVEVIEDDKNINREIEDFLNKLDEKDVEGEE